MSPKLRFKIEEREFEVEGTEEEIMSLYVKLASQTEQRNASENLSSSVTVYKSRIEMPSVEELISYILSKPRYEHDIIEIGIHFLKRQITSRDSPSMYRKLSFDLQKARKVIETQKQGGFEQQATPSKNLKKYVFKPLTRTLSDALQKTS